MILFQSLVYRGLSSTTVVNAVLLNCTLPLFIMQNQGPSLMHGSCNSGAKVSGLGGTWDEGQRAPLAALGAALLLGSALLRVRRTASARA